VRAALLVICASCVLGAARLVPVHQIVWDDVPAAIQRMLITREVSQAGFDTYISELRRANARRLREGDLDHLVYYILQSTAFTRRAVIEPAASAFGLVEQLPTAARNDFFQGRTLPIDAVPRDVQARIDAFISAAKNPRTSRFGFVRQILLDSGTDLATARPFLGEQYLRAMRFLYEKEFTASKTPLYEARGLSSDTSVDAGYVVYLALATLRRLEPDRRIRDVLIIGPGFDLAPRTGLVEAGEAQSYQPFAVMDALLATGLASPADLRIVGADINPRVVNWLRGVRGTTPRLTLFSGIVETDRVKLTEDYRAYFSSLGRAIGRDMPMTGVGSRPAKTIAIARGVTDAIDAAEVDITTERLDHKFDLIVVTNLFPYFSDRDLLLAMSNIAHMLAFGGVMVHNEPRPTLAEAALALGMPLIHSRSAVVADVGGARAPLYDSVWMHGAPTRLSEH
jgi:hypothetical protein